MKISGYFKDINDSSIYVEILSPKEGDDIVIGETLDSSGNAVISFSDEPIKIETECEDCFTVIIKKSCEINLLTTAHLEEELFANNSKSVSVEVKRDSACLFYGYVTPNLYNQAYSDTYNKLTLNCIDILSTLEYDRMAANKTEYVKLLDKAKFMTVAQYLIKMLPEGSEIWHDNSKFIGEETATDSVVTAIENVAVSESLWTGEAFDDLMTNEKIIEELLKYLNLHIIQEGKRFLIFDWNTIKNTQEFNWCCISHNYAQTKDVTSHSRITIHPNNYASDDTNISMDSVYNQIVLTDKIKALDSVLEPPLNEESLYSKYKMRKRYMTEIASKNGSKFNKAMNTGIFDSNVEAYDYYVKVLSSSAWDLNYYDVLSNDFYSINEYLNNTENMFNAMRMMYDRKFTPMFIEMGKIKHVSGSRANENLTGAATKCEAPDSMNKYLMISVNGSQDDSSAKYDNYSTLLQRMYEKTEETGKAIMSFKSSAAPWGLIGGDGAKNYFVFTGSICLVPSIGPGTLSMRKYSSGYYRENEWNKMWTYRFNSTPELDYSDINKDNAYYGAWFYNYNNGQVVMNGSNTLSDLKTSYNTYTLFGEDIYSSRNYPFWFSEFITDPSSTWKMGEFAYRWNASTHDSKDKIGKIGILQCQMRVIVDDNDPSTDRYCVEWCDFHKDASTGSLSFGSDVKYRWMTKAQFQYYIDAKNNDGRYIGPYGTTMWVPEESCPSFSLGFDPVLDKSSDTEQFDYVIGQEFDLANNIYAEMGLGTLKGTAIELPSDLVGRIEFKIIGLVNAEFTSVWRRHPSFWRRTKFFENSRNLLEWVSAVMIKDFKCEIVCDNASIENDSDKDLVYYSDETDNYVEKKDDIEFKVNTLISPTEAFGQGSNSISAPSMNLSTAIDIRTNKPISKVETNCVQNLVSGSFNTDKDVPERLYVDHYYKEYCKPKMIVETTLKGINSSPCNTYKFPYMDKYFFPLKITQDVANNFVTIVMKEI